MAEEVDGLSDKHVRLVDVSEHDLSSVVVAVRLIGCELVRVTLAGVLGVDAEGPQRDEQVAHSLVDLNAVDRDLRVATAAVLLGDVACARSFMLPA